MTDVGFVIFKETTKKTKIEPNILRRLALWLSGKIAGLLFNAGFFNTRLGTRLYLHFRKEEFTNGVTVHSLYEGAKAWIVRLPFTAGALPHFNSRYIIAYLERFCAEKGIGCCCLPGALDDKAGEGIFRKRRIPGKFLLKSMLVPVLEEICSKAGRRLESLELVIVAGDDNEELFSVISLLEPHIVYTAVVADDRQYVEGRLSELFLDSGLSFSVSTEAGNHIKHADLIINLRNSPCISGRRIPKKSLLIDLSDTAGAALSGENAVISNIAVDFTDADVKNLTRMLRGFYGKTELCEMLLAIRLNIDEQDKFSPENAAYIQEEFKKAHCRITGFVGRRSVISLDSVAESITWLDNGRFVFYNKKNIE